MQSIIINFHGRLVFPSLAIVTASPLRSGRLLSLQNLEPTVTDPGYLLSSADPCSNLLGLVYLLYFRFNNCLLIIGIIVLGFRTGFVLVASDIGISSSMHSRIMGQKKSSVQE